MPRFGPVVRIGWKRSHPLAMREAIKALDEKGTLSLVNKTKIARYYTLGVSSPSNRVSMKTEMLSPSAHEHVDLDQT